MTDNARTGRRGAPAAGGRGSLPGIGPGAAQRATRTPVARHSRLRVQRGFLTVTDRDDDTIRHRWYTVPAEVSGEGGTKHGRCHTLGADSLGAHLPLERHMAM